MEAGVALPAPLCRPDLMSPCHATSLSTQYFYNFTSWRNGGHGIFGKLNGDLHHINAKLVENGDDEYHQVSNVGTFA